MAKFIDLERIKPIDFPSTEMDGLDVVRYLNTIPTVDAVEVVRCRDCKYRVLDWQIKSYYCCHPNGLCGEMDGTRYCDCGERKDGDGNG